jgi:hypothetical protein
MRKLFFGLAFLGAMAFSNTITIAQTDPGDPGMGGEEKWVCCQVTTNKACTDMQGDGHHGTVRKPKC